MSAAAAGAVLADPHQALWIDGAAASGTAEAVVRVVNPYTGSLVVEMHEASAGDVDRAVASAGRAQRQVVGALPAHERCRLLRGAAVALREATDLLVDIVVEEVGKPIRDARREVRRAAEVFDLAADCARSAGGEVVPLDAVPSGERRVGWTVRQPVGVVAAIVPYNSPVNLTANKIAPALAAGDAVVVKPSPLAPRSVLALAQVLETAGLPPGACSVVVGGAEVGRSLVSHAGVDAINFTGGVAAGHDVARAAGCRRLVLELGSSSANVVCADADVATAARVLAHSSYLSAGQACISAQRLIVARDVYDEFVARFTDAAEALVIGDPRDEATDIGPMVSTRERDRVLALVEDARGLGARVLVGGHGVGPAVAPTLLEAVPRAARLLEVEAFGPVACVEGVDGLDEMIDRANDSPFGLQAGVFTRDVTTALQLAGRLEVGAVWVNESSRYRQDNYPFGGVKGSGKGREGVRYAFEEMSELKFIGINLDGRGGLF